jgi:hypothetical protein
MPTRTKITIENVIATHALVNLTMIIESFLFLNWWRTRDRQKFPTVGPGMIYFSGTQSKYAFVASFFAEPNGITRRTSNGSV